MGVPVTVVRDEGASLLLDGSGCLGHLPADRAMHLALERAQTLGVAAAIGQATGRDPLGGMDSR